MRKYLFYGILVSLIVGFATARYSMAQATGSNPGADDQPADPQQPTIVELEVPPAPQPHFALQYRLVPDRSERQPGNAAQFYYRALLHRKNFASDSDKRYAEHSERWLTWPPDAASLAEMKEWVAPYRGAVFEQLKVAAYREYCDWDFRIGDVQGPDVYAFLLEEVQETRSLARALQVDARVQMMERNVDGAFESLRLGFQLAHDVAETPILINSLVGISIGSMMTNELRNVIGVENSPNLYWAVSTLPRPFIEMRASMEQEMAAVYQVFPYLKDAETAHRSPDEWRRVVVESLEHLSMLSDGVSVKKDWNAMFGFGAMAAIAYPKAKQGLIASGLPAETVEAMPVAQVLAIQTARVTRYSSHETFKWGLLPYVEGRDLLEQSQSKLANEGFISDQSLQIHGAIPVAGLLLPAVQHTGFASIRLERLLAATRVVEALRIHAASHEGKLPATLTEIKEVPIPTDPLNNGPIAYRLDGDRAIIDLPPRPGQTPRQEGFRYIVRIRQK